ncbi:hypothetical protein E8E13_002018 [Curvularia kusanoi]|uniref:Uncharacterized protein n=1 Tax=Curvularia kusanoi TaxID=90978 RepID=A0A9P4T8D6_CURKU|nr:hypothetical protein E8E13_002018 [Curvularia kusanoi]
MASGAPCLSNCVSPAFSLNSFICHECRAADGNLASHLLLDAVCNGVKDYAPPEISTCTLAPALARPRFIASGSTIFTFGPTTPNTVFTAEPKAADLRPRTPLAQFLDKHPSTAAEVDAVNLLLKRKADQTTPVELDPVQVPTRKKMRETEPAGTKHDNATPGEIGSEGTQQVYALRLLTTCLTGLFSRIIDASIWWFTPPLKTQKARQDTALVFPYLYRTYYKTLPSTQYTLSYQILFLMIFSIPLLTNLSNTMLRTLLRSLWLHTHTEQHDSKPPVAKNNIQPPRRTKRKADGTTPDRLMGSEHTHRPRKRVRWAEPVENSRIQAEAWDVGVRRTELAGNAGDRGRRNAVYR